MANEVSINFNAAVRVPSAMPRSYGFTIQRNCLSYQGPSPGFLTATTTGIQIDTSKITNLSFGIFTNLSTTARLQLGVKDTSSGNFEPFAELDPLESWPIPLARILGTEETGGAGTGTAGSGGVLWAKGVGASVDLVAELFGR